MFVVSGSSNRPALSDRGTSAKVMLFSNFALRQGLGTAMLGR
jgi:hypothetical protein